MNIIGITKIRNEEKIIQDTLNHWSKHCNGGIYVYDDKSTDNTVEICKAHSVVKKVIEGKIWDKNRSKAEWQNRQTILKEAQKKATSDDWFVYFDADERLFLKDWNLLMNRKTLAISCKLYDVYITPEDEHEMDYNKRNFVGPEYRIIPFFFRNSIYLQYSKLDQRVVTLGPIKDIPVSGVIKHFSKGISVKHYEETCDYYINFFPQYAEKWKQRKGKAIKKHYRSDFGNELIKFSDVLTGAEKGFSLINNK